MQSLTLYIDKRYIAAAVLVGGVLRPVQLPDGESRAWLYFHEDTATDRIEYGKAFQKPYRDRKPHYYGDIFTQITDSNASFTYCGRPSPLLKILACSGLFDHIKAAAENDATSGVSTDTFISVSRDISPASRLLLREELENAGFRICQDVARIEQLALEYGTAKSGKAEEGWHLVVNACNENLRCSLYKRANGMYVQTAEVRMEGQGTDMRRRAIAEYVVDAINGVEYFLHTKQEREAEYLRMADLASGWLEKLGHARHAIPLAITGITLANDPHKQYPVSVKAAEIDKRTEAIVKDIVDNVARFVADSGVEAGTLRQIVMIGDTLTNKQFGSQLRKHFRDDLTPITIWHDADLAQIVGAYQTIDCKQFLTEAQKARGDEKAELQRIKNAEEEQRQLRKAEEEKIKSDNERREREEAVQKLRNAMDLGTENLQAGRYDKAADYFAIAATLQPDNEEAKQQYQEAIRLNAEQKVRLDNYKAAMRAADEALRQGQWETARQKAGQAIEYRPDSHEAKQVKLKAIAMLDQQKQAERLIDRADIFAAQGLWNEATEELGKAKLLASDTKDIDRRLGEIETRRRQQEQQRKKQQIQSIRKDIDDAMFNDQWARVAELCDKALAVDDDDDIASIKKLAKAKASQQRPAVAAPAKLQLKTAAPGAKRGPTHSPDDFFGSDGKRRKTNQKPADDFFDN